MDAAVPGAERIVLDEADIARALRRMAHEIVEKAKGADRLVLMGIPTRGVFLAHRIAEEIGRFEDVAVPVGTLDITLYRDDLSMRAVRALGETVMPTGGLDEATVVLVDDVLFSGRTIRAALDALNDLGRPSAVRLAVLIDRGHRELPIRPDYVGKNLPTASTEQVRVMVAEVDGLDRVAIVEGSS